MKTKPFFLVLLLGTMATSLLKAQTPEGYLEQLDSYYASYIVSDSYDAETTYKKYCSNLFINISEDQREAVENLMLDRLSLAGEKSNDEFIQEAQRFLFIAPNTFTGKEIVIEQLSKIYVARREPTKFRPLIIQLEEIQEATGNDLSELIDAVTVDYYQAKKWDSCEGYWVADRLFTMKDYNSLGGSSLLSDKEIGLKADYCKPFYVLDVKTNEVEYLADLSGFFIKPFKNVDYFTNSASGVTYYGGRMRHSQAFSYDKKSNTFLSYFGSEELIDGDLKTSNDWLSASQETSAALMTDLKTGDYSFGEKVQGAVLDGVMTGMMRSFARQAAVTKKYADILSINGTRVSPNVIEATFKYEHLVARNNTYHVTVSTPIQFEERMRMYRITPEMGITLSNKKGYPMFPGMYDNDELLKIRRNNSLRNPLWLLSTLAALAGGSYLSYQAFKDITAKGAIWKGSVGITLALFSFAIPFSMMPSHRAQDIAKYNAQQLQAIQNYYWDE